MNDEQRKRVHAITYSTQDRMELAERIVRLEDERDLYSSLVEDMDHPDIANQLRAENAKLKGLVKHLYDYREMYFKTGIYPTDHGMTERRMSELGIEVG